MFFKLSLYHLYLPLYLLPFLEIHYEILPSVQHFAFNLFPFHYQVKMVRRLCRCPFLVIVPIVPSQIIFHFLSGWFSGTDSEIQSNIKNNQHAENLESTLVGCRSLFVEAPAPSFWAQTISPVIRPNLTRRRSENVVAQVIITAAHTWISFRCPISIFSFLLSANLALYRTLSCAILQLFGASY